MLKKHLTAEDCFKQIKEECLVSFLFCTTVLVLMLLGVLTDRSWMYALLIFSIGTPFNVFRLVKRLEKLRTDDR